MDKFPNENQHRQVEDRQKIYRQLAESVILASLAHQAIAR